RRRGRIPGARPLLLGTTRSAFGNSGGSPPTPASPGPGVPQAVTRASGWWARWSRARMDEPVQDRPFVALWHRQAGHLRLGEQSGLLVFTGDHDRGLGVDAAPVGDDEDMPVDRGDVIHPRVEAAGYLYGPARFLLDLPGQTLLRGFPNLDLAAGQLPLVALIAQQQHPVVADDDALDRDGERARDVEGVGHGRARFRRLTGSTPAKLAGNRLPLGGLSLDRLSLAFTLTVREAERCVRDNTPCDHRYRLLLRPVPG